MIKQLPTVQLIGAQKAGTSAIADWLFDHGGFERPQVMRGEPWFYSKEVHFFDSVERYQQGVDFYARRFLNASRTLDATPDTLPFAERVRSIYEQAGGGQVDTVKFIVILRDPIARELSLYNHLAFDCRHLKPEERTSWHDQVLNKSDASIISFEEFVQTRSIPALQQDTGPGQSTRHSLYARHLRKWFDCFDRRQILILSYNELCTDPTRVQQRIHQFLGFQLPSIAFRRSNSNDNDFKIKGHPPKATQALQSVLAPENRELYRLLESCPGPLMEQRPFPRFPE
jgi:hypothetical protein